MSKNDGAAKNPESKVARKPDFHSYIIACHVDAIPQEFRIRITYDGETREPKTAEIIK